MLRVREQSRKVINGFRWISSGAASAVGMCLRTRSLEVDVSRCRAEAGGRADGVQGGSEAQEHPRGVFCPAWGRSSNSV